jgi:hypothetical protein
MTVWALRGEVNAYVSKSGKRRDGRQATPNAWERWQLFASITRIVVEILEPWLDRFGGPGRLM